MYITNAFSLQMIKNFPSEVKFEEISSIKGMKLDSAIGHEDTAHVLGFEPNRISIHLEKGDSVIIAQLIGGRLPEGTTSLPEGFKFKFIKATIL